MSSTEDKFSLVHEAAKLLVRQEFTGHLLDKFRPKVSIVVNRDEDKDGEDGSGFIYTEISLEYENGEVGEPANWNGIGNDVDDALSGNLLCLGLEISNRIEVFQAMLTRVKEALPDKFKFKTGSDTKESSAPASGLE